MSPTAIGNQSPAARKSHSFVLMALKEGQRLRATALKEKTRERARQRKKEREVEAEVVADAEKNGPSKIFAAIADACSRGESRAWVLFDPVTPQYERDGGWGPLRRMEYQAEWAHWYADEVLGLVAEDIHYDMTLAKPGSPLTFGFLVAGWTPSPARKRKGRKVKVNGKKRS